MVDANPQSKIDAAAEKAYADAATKTATPTKADEAVKVASAAKATPANKAPAKKPVARPVAKKAPVAAKKAAKPAAKKAPAKATVKKTAAKKTPAKKPVARKVPAKKAAPKAAPKTETTNPVTKLKDTIMAKAEKTDFAATAKEMAADVQERVKTAAAKTTVLATDVNDFNKANMEAVVESGKIFFAGAQELVRDNVKTSKTVVETVTEDAKKVASIKSPTELMQLQGELARRNFDAVVSFGSQRTEAWVKLYTEAFAPISNRVSVATEKFSKAA